MPSNESLENNAQTSSASGDNDDQFISILIGAADSDAPSEETGDVPDIIVEDRPMHDNPFETVSENSGLSKLFDVLLKESFLKG